MSAVARGCWFAFLGGLGAYLAFVGWVIVHEVRRSGVSEPHRGQSGDSGVPVPADGWVSIPINGWVSWSYDESDGDVYLSCPRCGWWDSYCSYMPNAPRPDVVAMEHEAECPATLDDLTVRDLYAPPRLADQTDLLYGGAEHGEP